MNNSISPRVTAWHPVDLESGDSGAIKTTINHCMDPNARFTPKMAFGPRTTSILKPPLFCGLLTLVPEHSWQPLPIDTEGGSGRCTKTRSCCRSQPSCTCNMARVTSVYLECQVFVNDNRKVAFSLSPFLFPAYIYIYIYIYI